VAEPNVSTPTRTGWARRDASVVAMVVLVLFAVGVGAHAFGAVVATAHRSRYGDDLLGALVIVLAGIAVALARRLRTGRAAHEMGEPGPAADGTRYRTIVERVPIVTYAWDSAFRSGTEPADYISPQLETLLGIPPRAWLDDPAAWATYVHPDDLDRVTGAWEAASAAGMPFADEYRLRRADGAWVWVRDEANPVAAGPHGAPLYQGVIVDITERRNAEETVRASEERWRSMLEDLPVVTYEVTCDDDGTIVDRWVAHGIEQLLGISRTDWYADIDTWDRMLHGDDRDGVLAAWAGLRADGTPFDRRYRMVRTDGQEIWVHDRAARNRRDGRVVIQGAFADVTDRMHAEAARTLAEERFRTLVEQLPVAVYTDAVDEVSTALYISPQYEALTGYSPEQRLRDPELWVRMLHPDDRERVLAESDATNASGEAFDTEYRIVAADGSIVWLHDHAVLVRDASGDVRWHGVLQDVTERHTAAEAIARRDAILEATSFAAERFLRAGSWTAELEDVLERLGRAGEATRCAVFRNHTLADGALGVSIVASFPPDDPSSGDESRYDFAWEARGFGRWVTELGAGRAIHGSVDDFPPPERALMTREPMSIRSVVAIPIFAGNAWWGYISFDHADEARRWIEADVEALTLTARTIGAAIDREHAIERLADTEARYRTLIEQIPAITYIEDLETGDEIFTSPQTHRLLGYAPQAWGSREQWLAAIHPDDLARVLEADEASTSIDTPFHCEYRLRTADGDYVWVRDEAVPIPEPDGSARFWQGVRFDITEAKRAEERLRDAEERYRAIVEHVPAAIYLDRPDDEMETVYISPQVRDILGVDPAQWLAKPSIWLDLMHPEDRAGIERSYLAAIAARAPWRGEYRMQTPDGRTVWIHDETTFLHGPDGEPVFLQGVLFDVTERKLAEQALRESEQRERDAAERLRALDEMKNTFLAAVSHELRSPLTSILGLALTLERAPDIEGRERDDLLTRLSANARKLDRLLKDLLDIDRLNRGIVEPQYRVTDVGALVRRTAEHLDVAGDRAIVVRTDPVVIPVDPPKIERIVENLVMNAVRHTEADRTIWLSVRSHAGGVAITVEDDGPGVPEELRDAIFEPFRQGPTASPHAPGTGIGLSLVARFAELHGGGAWVGERDGGGASFHVDIPGRPVTETPTPAGVRRADAS